MRFVVVVVCCCWELADALDGLKYRSIPVTLRFASAATASSSVDGAGEREEREEEEEEGVGEALIVFFFFRLVFRCSYWCGAIYGMWRV